MMGWLDKLKQRLVKHHFYAQSLNGFLPTFAPRGQELYENDVVKQVTKCIVDEIKKVSPTHVKTSSNDTTTVNSALQRVLLNPNPLMSTSSFLEKVTYLLLLNLNAFVLPTYDYIHNADGTITRTITGLYPLQPTNVTFVQDDENYLYVKLDFNNNFTTTVRYDSIIHLRIGYSTNEFVGGSYFGDNDINNIQSTIDLNNELLKGVAKSIKASYSINGIVKYNTMLDDGKIEIALQELENKLRNNESGFLPIDLKSDFIPVQNNVQFVDTETLKFIDEKITRNWGVPLAILTGDYTKEQYEAFYQKTLEPLLVQFSQEFTRKLLTNRERQFGNKIEFYPKSMIFMTVQQTLEMITLLANTGALYENEKRVAFGLQPLPELAGKRYMSLNWVDVDIATQYQLKGGNEDGNGKEGI